ncbi:outer membrane lipoprotein-sorting protein [Pseudoalteromonas sp. NBT06-2]|uniref:outer membrane lipoprotein-sorting protein n=1 Tax=Pseudoalteromonas sp. NBT06-2 TaxID=2025950 RepID=UPI000BA79DE8|nr:outer membrane lipoprotein-sorting protein [Pseudoalteromonas sp. NBT06-2]PAJ74532.1 outer membrane lipoprotein-sorting protein [Pseudoalteromonas sp. NBT06-2]
MKKQLLKYTLLFMLFINTFIVNSEQINDKISEITPKNATQLVSIIDSYRGLNTAGFSFDITNVSYKENRDSRTNQLSVDVKQDNSLVKFQSPARQQGRILLKKHSDMWLYIPGTRKVIRISPAQRLLGETSNADVTGSNFSRDYSGEIMPQDNPEQIKLILSAKENNMSYQKVIFWLQNQAPFKPIKSEYYARSGKLLKTAQYKAFKEFNGELKVHKMLLSDPLIAGSYTWMLFDNYRSSQLPDALFNKEAIVSL